MDLAPSSEGPGNGNVHNTLGGSAIAVKTVNVSPGVRTPPGKGGYRIGHMLSPSRGAGTPQGSREGPGTRWGNAQGFSPHHAPSASNSNNNVFAPSSSQGPPWAGRGSWYEQEAGRPHGNGQYISLVDRFNNFGSLGPRQVRRHGSRGRRGGRAGGRWGDEEAQKYQVDTGTYSYMVLTLYSCTMKSDQKTNEDRPDAVRTQFT